MSKVKGEKELTLELVEEAARDFNAAILKANERIDVSLPHMLFQEKHTTGMLWWKRTWYRYYKYSEGTMLGVPIYILDTLKSVEKGK